ncbi:cyclin-dependent kinase 12 [Skeletonema marinoi]|uniref:Cyclin-dependent kinase 2 homolog n=1 Tax=Skeletonema marinoi TaxID=267567 RepID=A0AAD8YEQ8_9STRA|nr:cyclin-dependent kinase 12 [Skeletonema marinoi]
MMSYTVEICNDGSSSINPLIARGAFGHVDIALIVGWQCPSPDADAKKEKAAIHSVKLAAIKTIPNATNKSSGALTREAFAELNALRLLNGHANVTPLLGYYGARDKFGSGWDWGGNELGNLSSLCLVFPYHPIDLAEALHYRRLQCFADGSPHQHSHLPHDVVKSVCCDILSALEHLHSHHILHRDVKPGNLYITKDGRVELGDFGLAKVIPIDNVDQIESETGLCTLQYRPPELLLGGNGIVDKVEASRGAMDIWSAGCIFAELVTLSGPLFPGQSVLDQLARIFHVLGTPTEEDWQGVSQLPDWNKVTFEHQSGKELQEITGKCLWSDGVVELTNTMLILDPLKRPSAQQCRQSFNLNDDVVRMHGYESVVKALIPSSLLTEDPIYVGTHSTEHDRLAYAKLCASRVACARRNFPKSLNKTAKQDDSAKWRCKSKPRHITSALYS